MKNRLKEIFIARNVVLLVLWAIFIICLLVVVGHEVLEWQLSFTLIAIVIVISILIISDAFRTGSLLEKNRQLHEAVQILQSLFNNARQEILIFSGGLNPNIYTENVVNALKRAKKKGVDIQAIVAYEDAKQRPLLNWLSQNAYLGILDKNSAPHFIVVDDSHVRAEHIHRAENKEGNQFRTADLSFYAPRLALFYKNRFEDLKTKTVSTNESSEPANVDEIV